MKTWSCIPVLHFFKQEAVLTFRGTVFVAGKIYCPDCGRVFDEWTVPPVDDGMT